MGQIWWVLRHREHGAADTFLTREEAEDTLRRVLEDEPEWVTDIWVEPFEILVAEPSEPLAR